MRLAPFVTIPKSITGDEELIVMPRRQFEEILKDKQIDENEILRWSREAKRMHRLGKLEVLSSLKNLR